ncbi:uncharacterized protein EMH_0087110 [Eimeria mitis]|uniref:Peptidase A2 domain-containing protein n=1 Tax=Eimeria mitis TaxID=44415 RepID=U6KEN1_9EIME|nr:uncharacterized protein EMH_0087110 [Eimeria mitis]CDJ36480.1 hypothetical protein, conserved [Eimeria mitis]
MLVRMRNNPWPGDYNEYNTKFSEIVAQGETIPEEELLMCFFVGLAEEIGEELTNKGTKEFPSWQEAATSLRECAAPLEACRAKRQRMEGETKNAEIPRRTGTGSTTNSTRRIQEHPASRRPGRQPQRQVLLLSSSSERGNDNGRVANGNDGNECVGIHGNIKERGHEPQEGVGQQLRGRGASDGEGSEEVMMIPQWFWWQEGDAVEHAPEYLGSLCSVGKTAVLQLGIVGHICEALLDTGASRSFIRPTIVERLGLKTRALPEAYSFTIANGEVIHIDREVPRLSMLCGGECFTGDFLVGPIPYSVILGIDWLVNHKVAWYFQSDKLRTYVKGRWCNLPVLRKGSEPMRGALLDSEPTKTAVDHAYDELAKQVARMTAEEAAAFLCPPSERYKTQRRARGRIKVKDILRQAREDTAVLKGAIQGLNCVVVLPAAEPDRVVHTPIERQGPLLYAIVEHKTATHDELGAVPSQPEGATTVDKEESAWPKAKLEFTEFDAWSSSPEALRLPPQILAVLRQCRLLFPDSLPD